MYYLPQVCIAFIFFKKKGKQARHSFLLTGLINQKDEVFAEYLPDFSLPMHYYNSTVLIKFLISDDAQVIRQMQLEQLSLPENHRQPIVLTNVDKAYMEEFLCKAKGISEEVECFIGYHAALKCKHAFLKTRIRVSDTLRCHRFDMTVKELPQSLSYFLYGQGDEAFLSHTITTKPDYHQVIAILSGFEIFEYQTVFHRY